MNKHTIFDLNKITKSAFAFVLAGSLSLTATTALAEENENIESQVVEETVTNEEVISLDDALVDENTNEVEEPELLPGDFFYFAKTALEKIQLILTFDDVKEAKLLAEFATERLAEAEALFSAGQEEEALAVMEEALENLSVAEETVSENTDATIEIIENDEEVVEETEEVEKQIAQNIISLKANMEKVKNPVAKAALEKNIKKSYAKLAEKMAKLEEKASEEKASEEESEDVTTIETEDETTTEETDLTVVDETTTEEEVVIEENTDVVTTPAPAAKVTNQVKVDQAQKKAEKQVVKQEKKSEKEQVNKPNTQQNSKASEQKGNGKN
ncbi:hypothetical protein DOE78_06950 [Bacillus sp. Y1]|nr:DUF5667 domain-containing protein [Bacillus sp. Y1]AYA75185.1 hypothetical protein DOE78_06950 [Bacillus sp. Y1]